MTSNNEKLERSHLSSYRYVCVQLIYIDMCVCVVHIDTHNHLETAENYFSMFWICGKSRIKAQDTLIWWESSPWLINASFSLDLVVQEARQLLVSILQEAHLHTQSNPKRIAS